MISPDDLARFRFALDANLDTAKRELVEELAQALKSEFGAIMRGSSGDESWRNAARGIIKKMGLEPSAWVDGNNIPYLLGNFPIAGERRAAYSMTKGTDTPGVDDAD